MDAFQDVFFEQLVEIRKTAGDWAKLIGIWVLTIAVVLVCFSILAGFMPFNIFIAAAACWGGYKLSRMLSVEYEYSVTNGVLDVTKILARSSRKFQLSLDLSKADRLEKYKPGMENHATYKKVVFACDRNSPDAYFLVVSEESKGTRALIFTPNDRIRKGITKGLPKFLAISAFKD